MIFLRTLFCALLLWFLSSDDGFQIRLGSCERKLFLPQASLELFVQIVSDRLFVGEVFVQIFIHDVLQIGADVSFGKPAGEPVMTFAEGVVQVTLIAQVLGFTGHVLRYVMNEATLLAEHTFGFSLLKDT